MRPWVATALPTICARQGCPGGVGHCSYVANTYMGMLWLLDIDFVSWGGPWFHRCHHHVQVNVGLSLISMSSECHIRVGSSAVRRWVPGMMEVRARQEPGQTTNWASEGRDQFRAGGGRKLLRRECAASATSMMGTVERGDVVEPTDATLSAFRAIDLAAAVSQQEKGSKTESKDQFAIVYRGGHQKSYSWVLHNSGVLFRPSISVHSCPSV